MCVHYSSVSYYPSIDWVPLFHGFDLSHELLLTRNLKWHPSSWSSNRQEYLSLCPREHHGPRGTKKRSSPNYHCKIRHDVCSRDGCSSRRTHATSKHMNFHTSRNTDRWLWIPPSFGPRPPFCFHCTGKHLLVSCHDSRRDAYQRTKSDFRRAWVPRFSRRGK